MKKNFLIVLSAVLFCILLIFPIFPEHLMASRMLAVVVLMGIFWIGEVIPLAVTSLLPLILFPILGIASTAKVATEYMNSTIFLFLGGFILSLAVERWNLHRRIALNILYFIGSSPFRIVLGFATATFVMSAFLSNTATAMIMLPVALSIILQVENNCDPIISHKFSVAVLLAVAYSASFGGVSTLIGTPPNLILNRIYSISFPDLPPITFASWLGYGIPIALGMLILMLFLFYLVYLRKVPKNVVTQEQIIMEKSKLPKLQKAEKKILITMVFVSFLWIFRQPIDLEFAIIPGWSYMIGLEKVVDDGTIAILGAIMLFLIPVDFKNFSVKILEVDVIQKIPWGIILLFGGGFALASGFDWSGLSGEIAVQLNFLKNFPVPLVILLITTIIIFMTEFSSNTAIATTMLPVVASIAKVLDVSPLVLLVPATISASFAFMLPVGTPPNAIVFSLNRISIQEMAKIGIILNLLSIALITLFFSLFN